MATNLGGVSWTVDADTSPAINSIKGLGEQVSMAEKSLDKLDSSTEKNAGKMAILEKATKSYSNELRSAGNTISSNGIVMAKNGEINATATRQLAGLSTAHLRMSKTAGAVGLAVTGMGRQAGQAGIQFQQLIGQIQGGQNFMVALSAQAADLGIVLGAPLIGAFAGIAASLGGMLLPSLMGGKTGMELMEKATMNVKAALTLGTEGVAEYSAQMKELYSVSAALAKVKLGTLIAEQNEAFQVGIKATSKLMDEARDKFALGQLFGIGNAGKEGIASFVALNEAVTALDLNPTAKSIEGVESAMIRLTSAGINNTKQGRALMNGMGELIAEYRKGKISIEALNEALKNGSVIMEDRAGAAKKAKSELQSLSESLSTEIAVLGMSERASAHYKASMMGATAAMHRQIDAIYDHKKALEDDAEFAKDIADRQKQYDREKDRNLNEAQSIADSGKSEVQAQKDKIAELEQMRQMDLENEAVYQAAINEIQSKQEVTKTEAVQATQSIIGGGESPEQAAITAKQEMLAEYYEQGLIDEQMFQDGLTAIQKEGEQARTQSAALVLSSFSNSFGQLADVLKSSEGDQSAAYKSMFALAKGFAMASAALNFALAVSNASAVPFPANIPAIANAVASGAQFVSAVSGASYSGREHGGSVIGGQTYEVGEKNKPELLMIPGNGGKVLSNSEMKGLSGGGGGTINQTINNMASRDGYEVRSRGDGITAPQVIDIIKAEMGNSSSYSRRALSGTSNVSNVTRSRR